MARDPACGMTVDEKKAAATESYQGKTYYFCSTACKATSEKAPGKHGQPGLKDLRSRPEVTHDARFTRAQERGEP